MYLFILSIGADSMLISDNIIDDTRLKPQDLGLLIKLMHHIQSNVTNACIMSSAFEFSEAQFKKIIQTSGRTALRASLKRLELFGYISRQQQHDINGRLAACIWSIKL